MVSSVTPSCVLQCCKVVLLKKMYLSHKEMQNCLNSSIKNLITLKAKHRGAVLLSNATSAAHSNGLHAAIQLFSLEH